MKKVALKFTFHTDIIEVPDSIANQISKIQNSFDKWLYDKSNNHGCWIIVGGKKKGVSFDTADFVNYINSFFIAGRDDMAKVVHTNLKSTPDNIPILYF